MIKLKRIGLPKDAAEWLKDRQQQYDAAVTAGEVPSEALESSYRDARVKTVLVAETNGKCAYCESKVLHIDHGDVEHILPKSKYSECRLTYTNLTLTCGKCNGFKSDYHHPNAALLNPFKDEPNDFLVAYGPYIAHQQGKDRGELTISKLQLNRIDLIERRSERMGELLKLVTSIERVRKAAIRAALLGELMQEIEADKEYVFVATAFLRDRGLLSSSSAP